MVVVHINALLCYETMQQFVLCISLSFLRYASQLSLSFLTFSRHFACLGFPDIACFPLADITAKITARVGCCLFIHYKNSPTN